MSERTTSRSGDLGFAGALTILFIGLKLTGYIDWSWVWVLSPIWIPLLVAVVCIALALMLSLIARLIK